jgi:hypothetical protein
MGQVRLGFGSDCVKALDIEWMWDYQWDSRIYSQWSGWKRYLKIEGLSNSRNTKAKNRWDYCGWYPKIEGLSNSRNTKAKNRWDYCGWYLGPGDALTHKGLQSIHVKRNLAYNNVMETVGSYRGQAI